MIRKNGPIPDVFTANKNLQSSENSFSNHEKDIEENKKIFTSLHQYAATECLPHMVHSAEKITKKTNSKTGAFNAAGAILAALIMSDLNK